MQNQSPKTDEKNRTREVTLIYVPIFIGGRHRGASMGPAAARVAELTEEISNLGFKIKEEIELAQPSAKCWYDPPTSGPRCVPEILEISSQLSKAVEDSLESGSIPITIGGDHSLAIGSITGVSQYYKKKSQDFGLVWFDAHGDINTPDTTYSGNVHGMPLAVILGKGDHNLTSLGGFSPKLKGQRAALIGLRDVDPPEKELIKELGVHAFSMRDIDSMGMGPLTEKSLELIGKDISGIHLSFDMDVMDPEIAPGVSTVAPGGMNFREAHLALTLLAETGLIRSIDFVELNPACDVRNKTAELLVDLLRTSLGHKIM